MNQKYTFRKRMASFFRKGGILVFLFFSLTACVDIYNTVIKASTGYLVIEGTITDLDEQQSIKIFRTSPTATFSTNEFASLLVGTNDSLSPVINADVKIIINNSETIQLTGNGTGIYVLPTNFRGKAGNSYQLKFRAYGFDYESSEEKMIAVPPIKRIYETFNPEGIKNTSTQSAEQYTATNNIYIDYDDPVETQNFYQWKWINWEIQSICQSCKQGRYYWYPNQQSTKGDCFTDLTLDPKNIYDYPCANLTWDIFRNADVTIFADKYTNGQPQKGKLVAQIPLRQSNPFLVAIQQASLTPSAYRYLKLLQNNVTNTGTLADTPPASIQGNIKNTSDEHELVIGYFSASSVSEARLMLDRRDTKGGIYNNLFYFQTSRHPNYDPVPHPLPNQSALGTESKNRTLIKPKGWEG